MKGNQFNMITDSFGKKKLLMLILFLILCFALTFYISNRFLAIFLSCIVFAFFILNSINNCLTLLIFFLPLQGIFDGAGFFYFYNILIFLFFIKLFFKKSKISKYDIFVILFFIYDILLLMFYFDNITSLLSALSLFISILCISFVGKNMDTLKFLTINNVRCFFIGCFLSAIFSYTSLFISYGFDLSIRLISLTRDANYFATLCCCGFFLADYIYKQNHKKKEFIVYKYLFLVLGLLTTSKMFLLVVIFALIVYCFRKRKNILANINAKKFFFVVFFILCLRMLGIFDFVFDRYIARINFGDITTGRVDITLSFVSEQFKDPLKTFFGVGTNYSNVYNIIYNSEHMSCHLTYVEIFLSFGIIGGILFLITIFFLVRSYFYSFKFNISNFFISFWIFLICCFAMWIFFMFLIGCSYDFSVDKRLAALFK